MYVSQGTNLVLLQDLNGDDKADKKEIILSGFDDHDTHHAHSAYVADPSGAILMAEGVFLHTNVETPYGPVRGTNGGFYRYNPKRHHLAVSYTHLSSGMAYICPLASMGSPVMAYVFVLHKKQEVL